MYIEQLYTGCLAEAAYYIESNGECAIVDPIRDIKSYLDKARERNARIKYIFETHFHADFVSGHLDLAKATGAPIVYGPGAETNFDILQATDGQEFRLGGITIKVLHTPGHTPESSTYLVLDENGKEHAIFTGDTLFIGDVGRPDLAQKGDDMTAEKMAATLYDSLRSKILPLPDDVMVYPGHGAGSSCGKNLSKERFSTLGGQKQDNYALQSISKEAFVKELTEGILPPPQYFPKAARLNKTGYDAIDQVVQRGMRAVSALETEQLQQKGALVLDTRHQDDYRLGHVPGSLFVGLDGQFAIWVGTLVEDLQQPIVVVAEPGREEEAATRLARVGYDNVSGYLNGGFDAWEKAGMAVSTARSIDARELAEQESACPFILDVRKPGEYESGHVENARTWPLDFFLHEQADLPQDKDVFVHCKSGYRSMIAHSILEQRGYKNVVDVKGGYDALAKTPMRKAEGQPA